MDEKIIHGNRTIIVKVVILIIVGVMNGANKFHSFFSQGIMLLVAFACSVEWVIWIIILLIRIMLKYLIDA